MMRIWVPGYDEVEAFFNNYKKFGNQIKKERDRLASICWKQTSYLRRDPTRAYSETSAIQRYIEIYDEQNDFLNSLLNRLEKEHNATFNYYLSLLDSPVQVRIITMFYKDGYTWVKIGLEVDYSPNQCANIRNQAIAVIADKIQGGL